MTVTHLRQLREQLKAINPEMRVATPFRGGNYSSPEKSFPAPPVNEYPTNKRIWPAAEHSVIRCPIR
jgi:hypothetical protein